MVTLALDTTTPAGSVGLRRDGSTVDVRPGDGAASPSTRLPRELTLLLEAHGLSLRDVDLFAVASGPGSLTGMRVGIATMQGLAFATGRPLAGVSALDALAAAGLDLVAPTEGRPFIGAWMHAHRGEVFSSLHCRCDSADGPDLPALVSRLTWQPLASDEYGLLDAARLHARSGQPDTVFLKTIIQADRAGAVPSVSATATRPSST